MLIETKKISKNKSEPVEPVINTDDLDEDELYDLETAKADAEAEKNYLDHKNSKIRKTKQLLRKEKYDVYNCLLFYVDE